MPENKTYFTFEVHINDMHWLGLMISVGPFLFEWYLRRFWRPCLSRWIL